MPDTPRCQERVKRSAVKKANQANFHQVADKRHDEKRQRDRGVKAKFSKPEFNFPALVKPVADVADHNRQGIFVRKKNAVEALSMSRSPCAMLMMRMTPKVIARPSDVRMRIELRLMLLETMLP